MPAQKEVPIEVKDNLVNNIAYLCELEIINTRCCGNKLLEFIRVTFVLFNSSIEM